MMMMASIAFSGEFGDPEWTNDPKFDIRLDVDAAAAELRQAGFEVFRLPDKYRGRMKSSGQTHPLDDFVEVRFDGANDPDVMNEINAIVQKYGGDCFARGPIEPGEEPFADLFAEDRRNDAEKKISYEQVKEATRSLAEKGLIVDSGRQRPGRNGEMEPVWVATPAGMATAEAEITSEIIFRLSKSWR